MKETTTISGVSHKRKVNGYSTVVLKAKRKAKRMEAEQRQDKYDNLTIAEKLILLTTRPGESKREKARLLKLQAKEKPVVSVATVEVAKKIAKTPAKKTPKK